MTSIDSQIVKLEEELSKLQVKQDAVAQKLLKLQKEKQEHETKQNRSWRLTVKVGKAWMNS